MLISQESTISAGFIHYMPHNSKLFNSKFVFLWSQVPGINKILLQ